MKHPVLAAPSLLSADFADIAAALELVERSGADWVHLDVMDGHFVPQITFGPKMIRDIRRRTSLPLDVHLMVEGPERMIDDFAAAGADYITFHVEACVHAHRTVEQIRARQAGPGVSIVPSTPVCAVRELLDTVVQVLVMTVDPGYGGQELIDSCVRKVRELADVRSRERLGFRIAVDGGINAMTAAAVRDAGADVLISGSAFFSSTHPEREVLALKGVTVA